ncbi:unnamed protein product, partial [Ectocarpus sp. 4 AP-2014]
MLISRIPTLVVAVALCLLVSTEPALGLANGAVCQTDLACYSRCCSAVTTSWMGIESPGRCQDKGSKSRGDTCNTKDGCDCEGSDVCDDDDKECK